MAPRERLSRQPEPEEQPDPVFAELEAALEINQHELDQNCIQHPDLFYRVSRGLARYTARRDEQKTKCAEVEALVDKELRRAAAQIEERITEGALANQKTNDPRVKLARAELAKLNGLVGQYTALKEAYLQRSYSLKGLIDLHLAGYFGDPSQRSSIRDRQNERAQRSRDALREERAQRGG